MKNYYEILGVNKNATEQEIKNAYKKLVKLYHPDLHPNDANCVEKFKEINEAHEILSDQTKRRNYDLELENPGYSSMNGGFSSGGFEDIMDIFKGFGDIFGNQAHTSYKNKREKQKGEDINIEKTIDFETSVNGGTIDVEYNRRVACNFCNGTGAKDASSISSCRQCNGTGYVKHINTRGFFRSVTTNVCDSCNGEGVIIVDKCRYCNGKQYTNNTTKLSCSIPPGADNGSYFLKKAYGHVGKNNGDYGDLYISIVVKPSEIFKRKEYDLFIDIPITQFMACLGCTIDIPLPNNEIYNLCIPECTQQGATFVAKGKGIRTNKKTGNLYIKINVETPNYLTKNHKTYLDIIKSEFDFKNYKKLDEFNKLINKSYNKNIYHI